MAPLGLSLTPSMSFPSAWVIFRCSPTLGASWCWTFSSLTEVDVVTVVVSGFSGAAAVDGDGLSSAFFLDSVFLGFSCVFAFSSADTGSGAIFFYET